MIVLGVIGAVIVFSVMASGYLLMTAAVATSFMAGLLMILRQLTEVFDESQWRKDNHQRAPLLLPLRPFTIGKIIPPSERITPRLESVKKVI